MKRLFQESFFIGLLIIVLLFDVIASFLVNKESLNCSTITPTEYEALKQEYQDLLKTKEIHLPNTKVVTSKIIFRDPLEFFSKITVLKGEEEGITSSSAVLSNGFLIGIVSSTTKHTSSVELLTNRETFLSVKIQDTYGILTVNEKQEIWIHDLNKEARLEEGNEVITSGLTEVPGGILIGTIEVIENDQLGLTKSAKVKLSNQEDINYVTIVTKEQMK